MPYYFKLGARGPVAVAGAPRAEEVSAALLAAGYFRDMDEPEQLTGAGIELAGKIAAALGSYRPASPKQAQTYQLVSECAGCPQGYRLNVAMENVFLNL